MNDSTQQQIALVTGASAGFGRAICERFLRDGYRVIAAARRMEPLLELRQQYGEALLPVSLDVRDEQAIAAMKASLPEGWRDIDVLVNNAGLALGTEKAQEAVLRDWRTMIDTNVTGLALMTHAFLPGMVARKRGLIVNIGSVAGKYPYPGGNVYGATKAFVAQFSRNLRADLAGTGVRVTDVQPGLCGDTEFSLTRYRGDRQKADSVYAGAHPLGPDDIAETVAWVASLPPRININAIEVMPTSQSFSALTITRDA
ncbi:SDR family NAD(P)-dependent oxidoreductase [Castellaniella defragrans]|uniref:3-hydroxy acid dehydrogenase/malonic semialdehyde reductase n=1 Tax=Castellaniella defragrans TaxID=75697 RepID=A0A7W9TN91_CASDE|nr:SDR family NAD(P)-dependent oxidoreductase [Castellaniella defragrans]KAB0612194.1 SDR family NAD(P)-dependent oxidoreductase [Castellaniella defragrans]MBB6082752.1 3-hydroxy acid dehydrogenase/malonic semialdehyde reductase [Castellaniella defragrans]